MNTLCSEWGNFKSLWFAMRSITVASVGSIVPCCTMQSLSGLVLTKYTYGHWQHTISSVISSATNTQLSTVDKHLAKSHPWKSLTCWILYKEPLSKRNSMESVIHLLTKEEVASCHCPDHGCSAADPPFWKQRSGEQESSFHDFGIPGASFGYSRCLIYDWWNKSTNKRMTEA